MESKDLAPDKRFEENYANAIKANVDIIGFYNYSYALTKEKAITDAKTVLNVLNGRKGVIWLDIEDKTQQGLRSAIFLQYLLLSHLLVGKLLFDFLFL